MIDEFDFVLVATQFASGDISLRDTALKLYRQLRRLGVPIDSHPALGFMSQIDTNKPDIQLRRKFRIDLIEEMQARQPKQSANMSMSGWHRATLSKYIP